MLDRRIVRVLSLSATIATLAGCITVSLPTMLAGIILPDTFDFSQDREQQCPKSGELESFECKFHEWGMPFGLPGLSQAEQQTLQTWLKSGAKIAPLPLSKSFQAIPGFARYRFLFEEAQFIIMNFIKAPVFRNQVALDVSNDQFRVFFEAPWEQEDEDDFAFYTEQQNDLAWQNSNGCN